MKSYCFDTDDAVKYGVDEAIILHNFKYWISHNIANKANLHDGRTWTYNSLPALQVIFPFWTHKQLRRIIKSLLNKKAIVTGNYNKAGYDRTTWYALNNEEALQNNMCPNGQMEKPIRADGSAQMGAPIPDINTDINTEENRSFDDFWPFYPKKVAKDAARKAWRKLTPEDQRKAFHDIPTRFSQDTDKQFIPNPATWLNGKRWKDERIEKPKTANQVMAELQEKDYGTSGSIEDNRRPLLGIEQHMGVEVQGRQGTHSIVEEAMGDDAGMLPAIGHCRGF